MILRTIAIVSIYAVVAVMASSDQVVLGPSSKVDFVRPQGNLPTLADLLTVENRASIFYSYAREVEISAQLMDNEGEGVTLFVPTNKAVQALARKPNEDPRKDSGAISDAEHDSASKSNVYRWVGAHVIPLPDVDFAYPEPYDTLTPGATITFTPINTQSSLHPPHGSDAEHFDTIKGSGHLDTDADHFDTIKGPAKQPGHAQQQNHPHVDTDADHFSQIKGAKAAQCPHLKKLRLGLAAAKRAKSDAAYFDTIKSPASLDRTSYWSHYVLNDGVRIIAKKQASNGVMYLIDGTVSV